MILIEKPAQQKKKRKKETAILGKALFSKTSDTDIKTNKISKKKHIQKTKLLTLTFRHYYQVRIQVGRKRWRNHRSGKSN